MKDKFRPIWGSFWTKLGNDWTILKNRTPETKCRNECGIWRFWGLLKT